ncbi:hypothetical protein ON010_g3468 [Phytophthora cinnamomi]|nr:hypothetical protein ON010_g3468 [Phytophthora cinnamomi]
MACSAATNHRTAGNVLVTRADVRDRQRQQAQGGGSHPGRRLSLRAAQPGRGLTGAAGRAGRHRQGEVPPRRQAGHRASVRRGERVHGSVVDGVVEQARRRAGRRAGVGQAGLAVRAQVPSSAGRRHPAVVLAAALGHQRRLLLLELDLQGRRHLGPAHRHADHQLHQHLAGLLHGRAGAALRQPQHDPVRHRRHVRHGRAHDGGVPRGRAGAVHRVHRSVRDRVRRDAGPARVGDHGRPVPGLGASHGHVHRHRRQLAVQPHRRRGISVHRGRAGRLQLCAVHRAVGHLLPAVAEAGAGDVEQVCGGGAA